MKNTWKGMALGAFTGAAIGIVMDSAIRGGQRAAELGASAKSTFKGKAPQAVDWAGTKGAHAADWARDQDLSDKAKDTVKQVVDKVHGEV